MPAVSFQAKMRTLGCCLLFGVLTVQLSQCFRFIPSVVPPMTEVQQGTKLSFFPNHLIRESLEDTIHFQNPSNGTAEAEQLLAQNYGKGYARLLKFLPGIVQDFIAFILANPFVGVIGLGSIVTMFKQNIGKLYSKADYQYTTTLTVSSDEQTFTWMKKWLTAKDWGNCQHVTGVISNFSSLGHDKYCECTECKSGPEGAPRYRLIPNLSQYGFHFQDKWISIKNQKDDNNKEKQKFSLGNERSAFAETMVFSASGKDPAIFKDLLTEGRKYNQEQMRAGTTVMTSRMGGWRTSGQKRKRPLESVILDDGVVDELVTDIHRFFKSKRWYVNRGIPHRRGYLLHGPPGCGKTSLISAIAGHFDLNVFIVSLSDSTMTDETLQNLINRTATKGLLLLEDIDAAFESRTEGYGRGHNSNSLSFSGLLNALDGVSSAEGRITFMTTNYVDRLDSALIRPGRVDVKKKIDFLSEFQVRKFFHRFYSGIQIESDLAKFEEKFVEKLKLLGSESKMLEMTPADLQGLFLMHRDDPAMMIDSLEEYLEEVSATEEKCGKKQSSDLIFGFLTEALSQ